VPHLRTICGVPGRKKKRKKIRQLFRRRKSVTHGFVHEGGGVDPGSKKTPVPDYQVLWYTFTKDSTLHRAVRLQMTLPGEQYRMSNTG